MKSYTGLIGGNLGKAQILRDNLSVITEVSNYVFSLGPKWWAPANQKLLYHNCRKLFPNLNSKSLQNFLKFHFFTPKKKPKKPPKASLYVDYQSFGLVIDKSKKLTYFWLRFNRINFPIFGKYLINRITDPSRLKLCTIYLGTNNRIYCKFSYDNIQPLIELSVKPKVVGIDLNTKRIALSPNKILSLKRLYHCKMERKKNKWKSKNLGNYTRDFLQKLTTEQVADFQHQGIEVLVLEDLKNLRNKSSKKLGTSKGKALNHIINSMPYRLCQNFLEYKCKDVGILFKYVPAFHTSIQCSNCGSRNTVRPKNGSRMRCKFCGIQLDADINAARNIRNRYTEPDGVPVNPSLGS